jgi:arginine deiminase
VFIDFVAAFDSVLHKLLDAALQAAGATDKSRAVFHAIYHKASAAVWVQTENGEETISRPFDIQRGVVQGDICSPYMYILALAFLFFAHDPEAAAGTGVTLAGGIVVSALT